MTPNRLLLLACLIFMGSAALDAQEPAPKSDLERRVEQLEEQIRADKAVSVPAKLGPATIEPATEEATAQQPPESLQNPAAKRIAESAGWKNGFFIQSDDKAYYLRITGQIQADYRAYGNDADTKDIDTFLARRARLGIEATVFEHFEFRLLPDYGQGQDRLQDAYMNVHYVDCFQFTAGKFKEPCSYEELIQDRFVPTVERSIIDQVTPQRDVGAMFHGQKLFDDRLDWAIGIFNGEINGDVDKNRSFDGAARVAVRPFNCETYPEWTRGLQLGVSGTWGFENSGVLPTTLRTPAQVPWFQFNPTVIAWGARTRITPEAAYFYRGFGCAAQYLRIDEGMAAKVGADRVDVPFEGAYFMATYLITGEDRTTYSQFITPLRPYKPLHPLHCPGAWELVARVSRLRIDDVVFQPGANNLANPANYASSAWETTVGFNWYLNPYVRVQFNWERSHFNQPVNLGAGFLASQDAFLTRMQVIF